MELSIQKHIESLSWEEAERMLNELEKEIERMESFDEWHIQEEFLPKRKEEVEFLKKHIMVKRLEAEKLSLL